MVVVPLSRIISDGKDFRRIFSWDILKYLFYFIFPIHYSNFSKFIMNEHIFYNFVKFVFCISYVLFYKVTWLCLIQMQPENI